MERDVVQAREAMVALIRSRGVRNPAVLAAMLRVPRHCFVGEEDRLVAYSDTPLAIGYRQTISQPYIVALMTEALDLQSGSRVLEIGTGAGYQAAVLAEMGVEVHTVEKIPQLYDQARNRLAALGYQVHCHLGDGCQGWAEGAPYAAIIVTAAPLEVPPTLLAQLADRGRLVIPLGPVGGEQTLWKIAREGDDFRWTEMGAVAFVPLMPCGRVDLRLS
jgi:protein-L-isoaspartate(D-aspartate) O-methyltransferase